MSLIEDKERLITVNDRREIVCKSSNYTDNNLNF
jgi:hypothetical protein